MLDWEIHNDYLQAYLDLGLPGLLLFIAFFFVLVIPPWLELRRPTHTAQAADHGHVPTKRSEGITLNTEHRTLNASCRPAGLLLAAAAAACGLAAMVFTSFLSDKTGILIWFAGVAAILNSRESIRPVLAVPVPALVPKTLNLAAAIALLFLAGVVGFTIRGDREFKKAERRALAAWDKPASERAAYRAERKEIERLATKILPTMQFDPRTRHYHCHVFMGLARAVGAPDAAEIFAREAVHLHPTDHPCLEFLTRKAYRDRNRDEMFAWLQHLVAALDYDPESEPAQFLFRSYLREGRRDEARTLRQKALARLVGEPRPLNPANRASRVPRDTEFAWSGESGADVAYEVYLWRTGEQTPRKPAAEVETTTWRPPKPLGPDTVYFWRVKAVGRFREKQSEIFFFRTERGASRGGR
jgi:hypothetical protein